MRTRTLEDNVARIISPCHRRWPTSRSVYNTNCDRGTRAANCSVRATCTSILLILSLILSMDRTMSSRHRHGRRDTTLSSIYRENLVVFGVNRVGRHTRRALLVFSSTHRYYRLWTCVCLRVCMWLATEQRAIAGKCFCVHCVSCLCSNDQYT